MLLSKFLPKQAHLLRVRSYPSVPLRDKQQLPRQSGIYYCLRGWQILYIGKSSNIHLRWNSYQFGQHHKLDELLRIDEAIGDVDLHFRVLPEPLIGWYEAREIARFKPRLNKRRESVWDNLNIAVIRLIVVKSAIEFGCIALAAMVLAIAIGFLL